MQMWKLNGGRYVLAPSKTVALLAGQVERWISYREAGEILVSGAEILVVADPPLVRVGRLETSPVTLADTDVAESPRSTPLST